MPRYQKSDNEYQSPPEFIRYIKHISGKPTIKVIYDPKLEYASGETSTYVKDDFVVSLTNKASFDSLFLYTDLDKNAVVNNASISLIMIIFLVGYNEKLFPPTLKYFLEYREQKVIG